MGSDSLSKHMIDKQSIQQWFRGLQDRICDALEKADGPGRFREDAWERPGGGGGRSRVLTEGNIIEKGGVNFSAVHGPTPEKILKALQLDPSEFFATGVSIVIHPKNPFVPIIHMNVRYFEMSNGTFWFGGGIDLTPHYIIESDARYFHQALKDTCDRFDHSYYSKFKAWADDYFYIPHRKETRGIGGIFFDRLTGADDHGKANHWEFVKAVGETFAPTYVELINRNKDKRFEKDHLDWQQLRRGRYVEFNLVYDKGTKFGLDTDGRTESILMSMPPLAQWVYNHVPEHNSPETVTRNLLKKGINWADD